MLCVTAKNGYEDKIKKGLSHSDAETVITHPSTYKCTADGEISAKKSHKKRKSVGKIPTDFDVLKTKY